MPGPLPKDDAERRRRNAPTIPTTNLPVSGFRGPIPEPLVELGDTARRLYDRAWRSPEAAAWHESDADVVAQWAGLKALVAAKLAQGIEPLSAILSQISAMEDRLGMTPGARARLRWRIVDDPPEVDESEVDGVSRFEAFGEVDS